MFTPIRSLGSQIIPRTPATLSGFLSSGFHAIAIRSGQLSPLTHLPLEQALFQRISKIQREALNQKFQVDIDSTPAISFLRTNTASGFVVIGQDQFAQRECNEAKMAEDGVQLVRRKAGGGAVFIDHGNVMFTVIRNVKTHSELNEGSFLDILIRAINETFNVKALRSGGKQNDVYVGDKKVADVTSGVDGDVRLFHACILVSSSMDRLKKYLKTDLEKLKCKGIVESHRQIVINLNEFDKTKTCEDLSDNLQKEFNHICPSRAEFYVDEKGILNIPEVRTISASMLDKNCLYRS
jgi:lipoate-protein ligase A